MRTRIGALVLLAALLLGGGVAADQLTLSADNPERDGPVTATYRLDRPTTATGVLHVEWTDDLGRLVERRSLAVALADSAEISFPIDMRRAATMRNQLRAWLSLHGAAGAPPGPGVALSFIARPPVDPWPDFQIIMWQPHSEAQYGGLRRLGFTAGMVIPNRDDPQAPIGRPVEALLRHDLRWYVENIATDLYASYHRWTPGRAVNWRFIEAKRRYQENPADRSALIREPSLSDPAWLARIAERLQHVVRRHVPYRPLFYSLGDEVGIADLAAFWDFDVSDHSLAAMRQWLQAEYGSLSALNAQWGTAFTAWDAVMPMTTAEAMQRTDDNFSAWADFKAWMDEAFARALRAGTAAVHAADPQALAGIEGGQIPGWGGYDYARLSKAVDLIELYDFGDNVELARAFNPEVILLGGFGGGDPPSRHALWRGLLRGHRGVVVWDEKHAFAREDGAPGPEGQRAQADLQRIRGGLGALLASGQRHTDPVGILYSPASFRTQWMLDWKPRGDAWSRRSASDEYAEDAVRAAPSHYARLLRRLGLQHRFLSTEMLEADVLQRDGFRALILPNAIALSPAAAAALRKFVEQGGTLIADSLPGAFDLHSRRLSTPLLAGLFGEAPDDRTFGLGHAVRLPGTPGSAPLSALASLVERAGVKPVVAVRRPNGEPATQVETSVFRHGATQIIALHRAAPSDEGDAEVVLTLPQSAHLYDLGAGQVLGRHDRLKLTLDPVVPTFLAASPDALPPPRLTIEPRLRRGETVQLTIEAGIGGDRGVLRLEVRDPAGAVAPHYSGVLLAPLGKAERLLPIALNDATGTWTVAVTDLLSGQSVQASLSVSEP